VSDSAYQLELARKEAEEDMIDIETGTSVDSMIYNAPQNYGTLSRKIAIVVGHTQRSPGAYATEPINQNEYSFNKSIAESCFLSLKQQGVPVAVFFRDGVGISGAYQNAVAWGASFAIELHFNGHIDTAATGTETLYGTRSIASERFASSFQSMMLSVFGLRDRGLIRREPGDGLRGSQNVNMASLPTALLEPFFGSNPMDSAKATAQRDNYIAGLVNTLRTVSLDLVT
jgi:N-acetylmuramoyl-L-alanine amidase